MANQVRVEIQFPLVVSLTDTGEATRRALRLEVSVSVDEGLSAEEVVKTAQAKAIVKLRRVMTRLLDEDEPHSKKRSSSMPPSSS